MPKTRAEISKKYRDSKTVAVNKKELRGVFCSIDIHTMFQEAQVNAEVKKRIPELIESINKQFNCIKFTESQE